MKCEELLAICSLTGIPPHELLGWKGADTASHGTDEEILAMMRAKSQSEIDHLAALFDKVRTKNA